MLNEPSAGAVKGSGSGSGIAGGSGSGSGTAGGSGSGSGLESEGEGRFSLVLEAMAPMAPTAPTPAAIVEELGEFSLSRFPIAAIFTSQTSLAGARMKTGSCSLFLSKAVFAISIASSMDRSPLETCSSKYLEAASISCIKLPSSPPSPIDSGF